MVEEPFRILCVGAHPDDIEFGCAGSVPIWLRQGAQVSYLIVTDGATGTHDPERFGPELAAIRGQESIRAGAIAGVETVLFLNYPDGSVEPTLALRKDIARVYRRIRPHRLVTGSPDSILGGWRINHPDHKAVGQACLDVVVTAGSTPGHFPELLEEELQAWQGLREVYVMGPATSPIPVDITSTIDIKVEALRAHASQTGMWDIESVVRSAAAAEGAVHGLAYAESFYRLGIGA